jgi:hypothetical protein
MPVDQVMQAVRKGAVQSHVAHGFTFVDVMPGSGPDEQPGHVHPPMCVNDASSAREAIEPRDDNEDAARDERPADELDEPEYDSDQANSPLARHDWKDARKLTSTLRIAPPRLPA